MKIYKAKDYKDMSRKAANIISAQVIISSDWRRSCCQSQYTVWFHDHLCRDEM